MCQMLLIKKRLLSPLQSGKYSSDFLQNFAEKKRVLMCSANSWIGTHMTFPVCKAMLSFFGSSKFSVQVYNTSDIPTGQTFAIN